MSGASRSSQVEDTVKDMWATRPRRPRRGRKVAGVAAGIGQRYGIDPVVPRVLFAVLTFYGGAGLLFYVLGWLLLPEEDDEVSPVEALAGKGRSATSPFFTVVLCASLIPLFAWFLDKDFGGFFGLVACAVLVYALHRGRAHLGRVPEPPTQAAPEHPSAVDYAAHTVPVYVPEPPMSSPVQPELADQTPRTTPPEWDPLGAAPFAWDLPEPSRPEPEAERPVPAKRSKAGLVTVGVSLLAVGGLVLAGPTLGDWVSVPHVIGVVLGIVGVGMFLGSFRRGGRGLIGLAAPLAALGIAMTVVWPDGFEGGGMGDLRAQPTTLAQVQPEYVRNVGSVELDLTALTEKTGTVKTRAAIDVGDVTVVVPATADVVVRCEAGLGDVRCLTEGRGGSSPMVDVTDYGPDGPGGLRIELHAEATGPGSVEVTRG
ncbi:PspC domain-containing protein [Actinokineospora sp. UTMC 2448]|uniref:PspC domain-containing protein n=1 Tax=Actinokineospora sp. UTMC 2448 TaxID=2268449 RepID=UPI002164BB73|nr:PspC domain-containing protein [Actinokineospora sp. UTMC 2448]